MVDCSGDGNGFVGRQAAMQWLSEQFAQPSVRLITVTGPPGAGKTTLAHNFARQEVELRGGVWVVDLAEARDRADLASAVAREVGLSGVGGSEEAAIAGFVRLLDGEPWSLLVLDDFERLPQSAGQWVSALLASTRSLKILVTSTRRLGLLGEHIYELLPLPTPDEACADLDVLASPSVALFLERARSVDPNYMDEPQVIAHLVRALDGLPLALELAARRVTVLSTEQLLARLRSRFELLNGGAMEHGPRHASLEAAIRVSWELLDPVERSGLIQSTVFRGGFDLTAAEAILRLREPASALDVIQALRERSFLQGDRTGGHPRFSMLGCIRDFAATHTDEASALEEAKKRHGQYYADWATPIAERLDRVGSEDDLGELVAERDNLRAVIRRVDEDTNLAARAALALDAALYLLGPADLHLATLDKVLQAEAAPRMDLVLRVRLHLARSRLLNSLGRSVEASAELDAAITLAPVDAPPRLRHAIQFQNSIQRGRVSPEAALSLAEQAQQSATSAQDPLLEARAWQAQAMAHAKLGALDRAEDLYTRASRRFEDLGAIRDLAMAEFGSASIHWSRGAIDRAQECLSRSIEGHRAVGNQRLLGQSLSALGRLLLDNGELKRSHLIHEEALAIHRRLADPYSIGTTLCSWAQQMIESGQTEPAIYRLREAIDCLERADNPAWLSEARGSLALAHILRGEEAAAQIELEIARDLCPVGAPVSAAAFDCFRAFIANEEEHDPRVRVQDIQFDPDDIVARSVHTILFESASPPSEVRSFFVRMAARIARTAGRYQGSFDTVAESALVVGTGGQWFRAPGTGQVDLSSRPKLATMLMVLVEAHRSDRALDIDDLARAVWPGEKLLPTARANRVYTAISHLRGLGLREVLSKARDGYRLHPDIQVVSVDE